MNNKQKTWLSLRPSEVFPETGVHEFSNRMLKARLGRCPAVRETRDNRRRLGVTSKASEAPLRRLSPGAHEPASAGRQVVHDLGLVQAQALEIDQVEVGAQPRHEPAAVMEAEEIGGLAGLHPDQLFQWHAGPAAAVGS
jgi:hypothetical protein